MTSDITRKRATLDDIALAVGVSKATVSKALNGRDDVSPDTRRRVLTAVTELEYRPTTLSMSVGVRRVVAVVFDLPASPYILGVLQGALAEATDSQIDLLTRLAPERTSRTHRVVARDWIAAQRKSGVVGIIGLTLSRPAGLVDAASDAGVPFIMVDPVDTRHQRMVSVGSSNWAGARTATEHLIELGHRRIAWIGGPEASDAATDRRLGYQAAIDSASLPIDPALIRSGPFEVANGVRYARELLTSTLPPTAIMAANDEIAVGVLSAAHELGVRVPQELSVTGFDDTPQAAWTTPPLTTVHQNLEGMGAMAVQTILVMEEGRHHSSPHVELATSLTLRASTAVAHHDE